MTGDLYALIATDAAPTADTVRSHLEATVRLHDELMCLGEDAGLWLAPGHHDADQMRAAVAAQVDDIYLPSEVADTPVTHVWVVATESWVEIVPPGTPGAEPHTRLLL